MNCSVLKDGHPMIGLLDPHDTIPGPPLFSPCIPHPSFAFLGTPPWTITSLPSATCLTQGDCQIMGLGSDIGPFIPHFMWPNLLLPVIFVTSASKSEFGVQSVQVNVKGEAKPIAVACNGQDNLNLNCAGSVCPPLPTGFVLAPNTHLAFMTPADRAAGIGNMIGDAAVQFVLNRIFGPGFGKGVGKGAGKLPGLGALFGKLVDRMSARLGAKGASEAFKTMTNLRYAAGKVATEYVKNVPPAIAAMTVGSPLGYTLPILPSGATAGTLAGEHVLSPLGEYFRGAAAPQVPAAKPAPQGTP